MKPNNAQRKTVRFTATAVLFLLIASPAGAQEEAGSSNGSVSEKNAPDGPAAVDSTEDVDNTASGTSTEAAATAAPEENPTEAASVGEKIAETAGTADTADASVEEEQVAPAEEAESKKLSDQAEEFFGSIGIRRLKGEDYPTYKTRGLKGGSLQRTFHGLQWPRMEKSGIGISGNVWIDTGYEKINRDEDPNQPNTKYILQEGRFVLRATPTYSRKGWFIQGQAELVANKDQTVTQPQVADVDDLWIRVGLWDRFDLQVGRFEAWELYHFGMGMDLNTLERRGAFEAGSGLSVPSIYGVTFAYYRPSGLGNLAAHIYATKFLRFELLGQLGNQGGLNTGAFRGAGVLDLGFMKLKGGGEYKKQVSQTDGYEKRDERGFGGSAQFIIGKWVEFGGSGGWAITDHMDIRGNIDEQGSYITWSMGGFANARIIEDFLIGGGANYTFLWDIHEDDDGEVGQFKHLQAFGALQYTLFDRLYIKAVVAFARGYFAPSFTENDPYATKMISGRLRLQYDF